MQIPHVETRFDANMRSYGSRVTKIKSRSFSALEDLAHRREIFDLIYVDAEHRRDDVLIDNLLGFKLLAAGGIMILDDYGWRPEYPDEARPKQAIDVFLQLHPAMKVLHTGYQLIAAKPVSRENDAFAFGALVSQWTTVEFAGRLSRGSDCALAPRCCAGR